MAKGNLYCYENYILFYYHEISIDSSYSGFALNDSNNLTFIMDHVNTDVPIPYDHKELLEAGKKIYMHKNCKLSRAKVYTKYKKCLSPHLADIVVIPKTKCCVDEFEGAVFIDETNKIAGIIPIDDTPDDAPIKKAPYLTPLKDIIGKDKTDYLLQHKYHNYLASNGVLIFRGNIITIKNEEDYLLDMLYNVIPSDKTVFETSVMNTLSGEEDKMTYDAAISLYDMLNSTDKDTVSAGLRLLTTFDYIHYENSIKLIMRHSFSNWCFNKATYSVALKTMLKYFCREWPKYKLSWSIHLSEYIHHEDFDLVKKLTTHFSNGNEDDVETIVGTYPFVRYDKEGKKVIMFVDN